MLQNRARHPLSTRAEKITLTVKRHQLSFLQTIAQPYEAYLCGYYMKKKVKATLWTARVRQALAYLRHAHGMHVSLESERIAEASYNK